MRVQGVALVLMVTLLGGCGDDTSSVTGVGGAGATGGEGGATGGEGVGAGGVGGEAVSECDALSTDLTAALQQSFEQEVRSGGTVAAVLTPTCRWTGAVGEAEPGVPLEATSLVRIGSVTKTYVAAAMVTLAELGVLSLDDALIDHVQTGLPNEETITLRQILNHTAGIYNYTDDAAFMNELAANPEQPVPPQQIVEVAIAAGASFAPGESWSYSNTGYTVLGMVLEQNVSERNAGAHLRASMLVPNGLDRTFLDGDEPLPRPIAKGWFGGNDQTNALHPSVPWTAGSMVAEAGDLVDWLDALYDGDAISERARAEMFDFVDLGGGTGYGLGVLRVTGTETMIGHTGGIPGYLTVAFYLPDRDVSIATVVNNAQGDPNVSWEMLAAATISATPGR